MRYVLIGISVVFSIIFLFSVFTMEIEEPILSPILKIGDASLAIEIADMRDQQILGLSGRESLPENAGMLFVYASAGNPGIWMKNMNFAIDIIWIDKDRKVVQLTENVSPDTYPTIFRSDDPILYILEVNAGWVEANNIKVGDRIVL
tara:strand:+ start:222 stop:662 length:441 start_codon:yes stop_codon:yes gene_type:complete